MTPTKSKEEILAEYPCLESMPPYYHEPDVLNAMQSYADLQTAELTRENETLKAKLEKQQAGEWIDVETRLPELGEKVLICRYGNHILMGQLLYKELDAGDTIKVFCAFFKDKFTECERDSVTHWMPLPNPPQQ
jgi:hypothetical protein